MKVVAFNGSPHKEGNTYHALKMVGEELQNNGIDFEIIQVGNKTIRGCIGCGGCVKSRDEKCSLHSDEVNDWIQVMKEADGIIISSPVHYSGISGTMKSFLDRAFYVASVNKSMFRHKVGASVVAVRRSGGSATFDSLNHYINYSEMFMPGSNYWNIIHGTVPGDVYEDEEGKQIMSVLGKNMAYLLNVLNSSKETVSIHNPDRKIFTNFVRK